MGEYAALQRIINTLEAELARRDNELERLRHELKKTQEALATRKQVKRAKGVLMEQCQLSESTAHRVLIQTAMNNSKRIGEIAETIIVVPSTAMRFYAEHKERYGV